MSASMTQDEFAGLVSRLGFTLDAEECARLREGYDGLQTLLARLPAAPELTDEPTFVQLPAGARVVA